MKVSASRFDPIVYLGCIVVKIRRPKQVINKSFYLALGVNLEGHKAQLGMWLSENEGANFWLGVLTDSESRRQRYSDSLRRWPEDLPDAIAAVCPQAQIHLHRPHDSQLGETRSWKDYKPGTADLKRIYQSDIEKSLNWCRQMISQKGGVTGDPGSLKETDHAYSQREDGPEPLYD
jgi:transposase-like protein